jgi:hypothetical protein
MAPGSGEFGRPTFVPGWLDTTTAFPAVFPPAFAGGASGEPKSSWAPAPAPWLPRPLPDRALPPPRVGGGGTTVAEPRSDPSDPADRAADSPEAAPLPSLPSMLAGGATTCGVSAAPLDLANEPPPDADGGGGTGFARRSPVAVAPQLLRSRLTCDGGGATTTAAGKVSLGVEEKSRGGAEAGGGTTSTVCAIGVRELARSRGVSRGAGATTVCASGSAVRILSRVTLGAGCTTDAFNVGEVRVPA